MAPDHPLCEVFGYPYNDFSEEAKKHRSQKLCPYNNRIPQCTKSSKTNPIGVCTMWYQEEETVICPVRFRQNWRILKDAASFLLPEVTSWSWVSEAYLRDAYGASVGKIDFVLVAQDEQGRVTNFGALEVQSVYVSGNITNPFKHYMEDPATRYNQPWSGGNDPRPDWLSSDKRLAYQLAKETSVLRAWNKRMAVAVQSPYFENSTSLWGAPEVPREDAQIAWFIYDLRPSSKTGQYDLILEHTVYMSFDTAVDRFTSARPGDMRAFTKTLEKKIRNQPELL